MRDKTKGLLYDQFGSVILLVSLALLGILVMTGLVIDGGTLYITKTHLQKTANAAALSGAQELTNSEAAVSNVISHVLGQHHEEQSVENISIQLPQKVSVSLSKQVPLTFSGLLGFDYVPVAAKASAEVQQMGRAAGASPLGIDDSLTLEYYKEYNLKVDQNDVDTGNFGVLALGSTGAKTYEYNLKNGYDEIIGAGDIIETQTGNISGKTRDGIKERLNACPYPRGETFHRDCSRILLIPSYTPYTYSTNQLMEVQITGFAYFYILDPMDPTDTSIKGMFVKRAGTGFTDPSISYKGALAIRLTE
jgi:hypothetical protein